MSNQSITVLQQDSEQEKQPLVKKKQQKSVQSINDKKRKTY